MKREIIVGTRESALAMWQTNWVVEKLQALNPNFVFKIVKMKTKGDKILDVALAKIGDKGLFTKELEKAMLKGDIDMAVHSLKDMPTKLPAGLKIGAVCQREHPGDVLISRMGQKLAEMPKGARIGTSSLRRCAQLLNYRPDLQLESLRGNLNTRMEKLQAQQLDGIILAAAGVIRMGWEGRITEYIPYDVCLPAVGQGAICVEIRADDRDIEDLVRTINHRDTELATTAERALLRKLEGGCQVPIGALAEVHQEELHLEAAVLSLDGTNSVRLKMSGHKEQAEQIGIKLAERLLANGADKILEQVRKENEE